MTTHALHRARTSRVTDTLASLKAQGVDFDTAWQFATSHLRGYFTPTALDDGTSHPCGNRAGQPHHCGPRHNEPLARFQYRALRAAYLGIGPAIVIDRDLGDGEIPTTIGRGSYRARGAMAA